MQNIVTHVTSKELEWSTSEIKELERRSTVEE